MDKGFACVNGAVDSSFCDDCYREDCFHSRAVETTFVNLTPHRVTIILGESRTEIPPSGTVARITARYIPDGKLGDFPVTRCEYGEIEGLPAAARPDYDPACVGMAAVPVYIVSGLVLARCAGRADVFAPDTGAGAVRDSAGRIIGTTRLIRADPISPALSESDARVCTCGSGRPWSRCSEGGDYCG